MSKSILKIVFLVIPFFASTLISEISKEQKELLESLPPDQRASVMNKMEQANDIEDQLEKIFKEETYLIEKDKLRDYSAEEGYCEDCIYGYNIFRFSPTTFATTDRAPVSSTYILGPGDKLSVEYFGTSSGKNEEFITSQGLFDLPILGPINLAGLTFVDAQNLIKERVSTDLLGTKASVTLSELRTITVYILGEAFQPGSYIMSSTSTITNALFVTGGVNESGSLRNIQLKRNGEIIKTYDLYDLILEGNTSTDVRLQDGDTIFIPFIENTFRANGSFKRPHKYEFRKGEKISDAIQIAGGFDLTVPINPNIELSFIDKSVNKRKIEYLSYTNLDRELSNADTINVQGIYGLKPESITLKGEFNNPGVYSILENDTILDIINRAGGYNERAYIQGAVFTRKQVAKIQKQAFVRTAETLEKTIADTISRGQISDISEFTFGPISAIIKQLKESDPIGRQVVDVSILNLKNDVNANFAPLNGDVLHMPRRPQSVTVTGEVLNPTTLSFDSSYSLYDYLGLSGGLTDVADEDKIFVIKPNGQSVPYKNRLLSQGSGQILPGSTIVVSRDSTPFDAIKLTQIITPILADLATSAAAIAAISD